MAGPISDLDFAQCLRQHHARLFGFVRAMVLNADDAHDVYQEAVLALWQHQATFDPQKGDFARWATGVARNKVFDYFKAKGRDPVSVGLGHETRFSEGMLALLAQRQLKQKEDAERLAARERALASCMETISNAQRDLLRRCYEGGEPVATVAAALGRTPGSVHSSLHHIRSKLLKCIRGKLAGGPYHVG